MRAEQSLDRSQCSSTDGESSCSFATRPVLAGAPRETTPLIHYSIRTPTLPVGVSARRFRENGAARGRFRVNDRVGERNANFERRVKKRGNSRCASAEWRSGRGNKCLLTVAALRRFRGGGGRRVQRSFSGHRIRQGSPRVGSLLRGRSGILGPRDFHRQHRSLRHRIAYDRPWTTRRCCPAVCDASDPCGGLVGRRILHRIRKAPRRDARPHD